MQILIPIVVAIVIFFVFIYFVPINLWIIARFSGVKVGLFELMFMRIRRCRPASS